MKYYSEITKKNYDDENECLKAERDHQKAQVELKKELDKAIEEKKLQEDKTSDDKKSLVKAIDESDARLNEAKTLKAKANKQCDDIISIAYDKCKELLDEADKKIQVAAEERYGAISQYNKKYGTYTRQISGEKAAVELNDLWSDLFKSFKWIW